MRPSLVYGPGDHFFGRFAAMARTSPVLPVIGGGRTLFQPIHVEDAARAIEALLDRAETAGMILALVGTETFTFRELLQRMLGVLGRRRPSCRCRSRWRSGLRRPWSGCRIHP